MEIKKTWKTHMFAEKSMVGSDVFDIEIVFFLGTC